MSSVHAHSARGRLTLRIAVRDLGGWGERVQVRWGDERRTYALPPAHASGASWRRLEVSRPFRARHRVLVGISVVRSELSHVLCRSESPWSRRFSERTVWWSVR